MRDKSLFFFFSRQDLFAVEREIAPFGKVPSQGDRKSAESSYGEMARLCSRFQAIAGLVSFCQLC